VGRDALPILLFSAAGAAVFIYQWGPPTLLGFAVLGSGLILTALKPEAATEASPAFADVVPELPPLPMPESAYRPQDRANDKRSHARHQRVRNQAQDQTLEGLKTRKLGLSSAVQRSQRKHPNGQANLATG